MNALFWEETGRGLWTLRLNGLKLGTVCEHLPDLFEWKCLCADPRGGEGGSLGSLEAAKSSCRTAAEFAIVEAAGAINRGEVAL